MIIARSPFSLPTAAFTSHLTCLLFTMSYKWKACSQAKDNNDDGRGNHDDGDDDDNDHHHDDQ